MTNRTKRQSEQASLTVANPGDISRNTLADLAPLIRAEHDAVRSHVRASLEHAFRAGELLLRAKDLAGHGYWSDWLHEHCDVSERTAQTYMRLARHRAAIEANPQSTADLTIEQAVQSLAKPKPIETEYTVISGVADHLPAEGRLRLGTLEDRGWTEMFAVMECDTHRGYFHVGHWQFPTHEEAGGTITALRRPVRADGIVAYIEHMMRDPRRLHDIVWEDSDRDRAGHIATIPTISVAYEGWWRPCCNNSERAQ